MIGRSVYEVLLTRTLRADNDWALLDGTVVVLVTIVLTLLTLSGRHNVKSRVALRAGLASFVLGAMTVGLVVWAVYAPLPEQRAVPLPPVNASPQSVVKAYVAALDEHDAATADALWSPVGFFGGQQPWEVTYYIRVRITSIAKSLYPDPNDPNLPRGVTGVDVAVNLSGWARDGGPVGEGGAWGYTLAPIGPHHAWRLVDEGTG
jgi:hypothetical protein